MIIRRYTRRPTGRSLSDPILLSSQEIDIGNSEEEEEEEEELNHLPSFFPSQESIPPRLPFSSQDSSSWSLDPFEPLDDPDNPPPSFCDDGGRRGRGPGGHVTSMATLMETQEFGEMMEHVDEVNFALDGLRLRQPTRVRRASLLSLLSICGTVAQRRLLRSQGMSKRIVDAILDLNCDDRPSMVAAATLFFVLACDVQEDSLLDSPSCIRFLLKLLDPLSADMVKNKAATIGSKISGIHKAHTEEGTANGLDSSAKSIISKVTEILLSTKEIKTHKEDVGELERPELCAKWIALLTLEKACLSTVSFEDTSDMVKKSGGNFKEKLRELGGLDAIFDVLASSHSTLKAWSRSSTSTLDLQLKDDSVLKSMVLLLKCLKILENATFLSKDNQNYLLEMKGKLNSDGLPHPFIGVIISAIKVLSDLALVQSNGSAPKNEKSCLSKLEANAYPECSSAVGKDPRSKIPEKSRKRQRVSASQPEMSVSHSEMDIQVHSSVSLNGIASTLSRHNCKNPKSLEMNMNGSRWISITANGTKRSSDGTCKKPQMSRDSQGDSQMDMDPFAFDEDELAPSKWEVLAKKNEDSQPHKYTAKNRKSSSRCEQQIITVDDVLSQITNEDRSTQEGPHSSSCENNSELLGECLLSSVKVLMNLTNDNPLGCRQIAACGGLDRMASLIASHFPSFDLCLPVSDKLKSINLSSNQTTANDQPNHRYLSDHELDFLVAILGLLVNLVEKDGQNRLRLASASVTVNQLYNSQNKEIKRDVIPLLCSVFLANQGNCEAKDGEDAIVDEESLLQGEREAEMMIIEAYSALLLAFLSTESMKVREAIASFLPNNNLKSLVPVLERFLAFHLTLNMIPPETHSAVVAIIESCKGP